MYERRRWRSPLALLAVAGTLLVACGTGAVPSTRTIENDGQVCLLNPSTGGNSVKPGKLRARVNFDTCLSSTCDEVREKNCSATLEDSTVVIESKTVIVSKGGPCSADCGVVSATCEAPSLESGDYRLKHGKTSTDFTLPSDEPVCLSDKP